MGRKIEFTYKLSPVYIDYGVSLTSIFKGVPVITTKKTSQFQINIDTKPINRYILVSL